MGDGAVRFVTDSDPKRETRASSHVYLGGERGNIQPSTRAQARVQGLLGSARRRVGPREVIKRILKIPCISP